MNDYMTNAQGHLVPLEKVKPADKIEHDLVSDLIHKSEALFQALQDFKEYAYIECDTFLQVLSEDYQVNKGGSKGNVSFTSYDGLKRVQVSMQDFIDFGAQLQVAKQLIDECINDWSSEANANLKAIVDQAFNVDKNNRFNTQAILGLRRLDIDDERWKRAMEAIGDSIRITSTKRYIRFYKRENIDAPWQAITLDLAKV